MRKAVVKIVAVQEGFDFCKVLLLVYWLYEVMCISLYVLAECQPLNAQ